MVLVDLLKQFSIRQMTGIMGPRVRGDDEKDYSALLRASAALTSAR